MCSKCENRFPTPIMAAGPGDFIWGMFNNVMGFPGRIQGMLLNAVVNTIDRAQTEQAIRDTKLCIEREKIESQPQDSASS